MGEVWVRVRVDETEALLLPWQDVGRGPKADLRVRDPRVSDRHAWISLNTRGELLLKASRPIGAFGQWSRRHPIAPGPYVLCPDGPVLEVLAVAHPTTVVGLSVVGPAGRHELGGLVGHRAFSVLLDPAPMLQAGLSEDAVLCAVFDDRRGWVWDHDGAPLRVGDRVQVGASHVVVGQVPLARLGLTETRDQRSGRLEAQVFGDGLRIGRPGQEPVHLSGRPAVLLSTLMRTSSPMPLAELRSAVLQPRQPASALRTLRNRLRDQLQAGGLPRDLLFECDAAGAPRDKGRHWWVHPDLRLPLG